MTNLVKEFMDKILILLLIEGVSFLLLGIVDLAFPVVSSIALALLISIIFIALGAYKFINAIVSFKFLQHAFLDMGIGILAIVIGSYLFMHPAVNLALITIMVAIYFILEGVSYLSFALHLRGVFKYWWINFFVAAVEFILGILIIMTLPQSSLFVLGLLIGISLIFTGMSLLTIYATSFAIRGNLGDD